jgi:hypothetical protein
MVRGVAIASFGICAACTAANEPNASPGDADAWSEVVEVTDDSCDFDLVLGQGVEAFEPCDGDEKTLILERGNQGLQHVIVSARAPIRGGFHPLSLSLWQEGDDAPLVTSTLSVPWGQTDGGLSQVLGVLFVIETPETVIDRPLRLEARVSPEGQALGCATLPVEVRW